MNFWSSITRQTQTTYSITPLAVYTGNLSNGGETITLEDNTNNVVSTVTYSDSAPWPTSPDGTGPSLELKATNLDTTNFANWGASLSAGGTPETENSLVGLVPPTISDVTDPNGITENDTVTVTATVTNVDSVDLIYKINFDSEQTVEMFDDGNHDDGAPGDDVYGAEIPGQAIGTLVRFKIEATNNDGTATSPSNDDSINYHGYYIADPNISTNAEVLDWFIDEADYSDMQANHQYDNVYLPCVFVYGDDVYDNSEIRIRGDTSRDEMKKSYKVKLPKGYEILIDGANLSLNEFSLNGYARIANAGEMQAMWWAASEAGLPVPDTVITRLQKNGSFYGLYQFIDKYDKEWRLAYGYDEDNGELYEDSDGGNYQVISGAEDVTRLYSYRESYNTLDRLDPANEALIKDTVDLPNLFNYMGFISATGLWDNGDYYNSFSFFNTSTERWSRLTWDLDGNFDPKVSPYDYRNNGLLTNYATHAIYNDQGLRQLYFRRLRTIVDSYFANQDFLNALTDYAELYEDDMALDIIAWPDMVEGPRENRGTLSQAQDRIAQIVRYFFELQTTPWSIPGPQTDTERQQVSIAEVVSANDDEDEFIRLYNSADTPVDISNWYIEGIDYAIPAGAVIPANGSIYLLKHDVGYKASHDPVLVAGQYSTDLSDVSGTHLVLKTNTNVEIDDYDY